MIGGVAGQVSPTVMSLQEICASSSINFMLRAKRRDDNGVESTYTYGSLRRQRAHRKLVSTIDPIYEPTSHIFNDGIVPNELSHVNAHDILARWSC